MARRTPAGFSATHMYVPSSCFSALRITNRLRPFKLGSSVHNAITTHDWRVRIIKEQIGIVQWNQVDHLATTHTHTHTHIHGPYHAKTSRPVLVARPSTCWFQGVDTRSMVYATVSHLCSILVVWSATLTVCRHAQVVRPEDVYELRVAIFRHFCTKLVEQPLNQTANDQECYCFSPEVESTLVQSVVAVTRSCGSKLICML